MTTLSSPVRGLGSVNLLDDDAARPPMGLDGADRPPWMDAEDGTDPYGDDSSPRRGGPLMGAARTGPRRTRDDALRFAASAASAQGASMLKESSARGTGIGNAPATGGSSRRGGDRAGASDEHNHYEVFPRQGARKPALLLQLESLLQEKLRQTGKLAEAKTGRWGAASHEPIEDAYDPSGVLALEAHRQTFEAFINAFATYRPLLEKVKDHYDRALDAALKTEHENVFLRSELAAVERRKAKAIESARAEANAKAANARGDLARRAVVAEEAAAAAAKAVASRDAEIEALRAQVAALTRERDDAVKERGIMRDKALADASWSSTPATERLSEMTLPPVPPHFQRADVKLEDGEGGLRAHVDGDEEEAADAAEEEAGVVAEEAEEEEGEGEGDEERAPEEAGDAAE